MWWTASRGGVWGCVLSKEPVTAFRPFTVSIICRAENQKGGLCADARALGGPFGFFRSGYGHSG